MNATRRHVLIVGTQCEAMNRLEDLEPAVAELRDAMCDPAGGACEPGLADATATRAGNLSAAEIVQVVRAAAQHAVDRDAILVLALLGHGFVAGDSTSLYFMAHESKNQNRRTAVDVRSLLIEIIDDIRIRGLIVIVDTCAAGGAVVNTDEVLRGTRRGSGRVAMLLASSVSQRAFRLQLSRGLATLLRDGVAGAGARLDIGGLRPALQRLAPGQNITRFEFDGDAIETEALWLGHNRVHVAAHGQASVGSRGMLQLGQSLAGLDPSLVPQAYPDLAVLSHLASQIKGDTPAMRRAAQIVGVLHLTVKTVMFLREHMPHALTSSALDQALARLDILGVPDSVLPDDHELVTETDFVEHVALRRCGQACPAERSLAYFVAGLAFAVGAKPDAPAVQSWAASIGAAKHLNDATAALHAVAQRQRLRLIVSLHASATGETWPDNLDIWLLDAGADPKRHQIRCVPTQQGIEAGMAQAVEWAEDHATRLDLRLDQVDVAVPTGLLLRWRPAEVVYGEPLGLSYHVLTRWSQRLNPAHGRNWVVTTAKRRLQDVRDRLAAPELEWLSPPQTQAGQLDRQLRDGRYSYAVGLTHQPDDADVLDRLLAHLPIVLWPHQQSDFAAEKRRHVTSRWNRLPGEFRAAYHRRSRGEDDPLAELCAVWDDLDWLSFCLNYRQSSRLRSMR